MQARYPLRQMLCALLALAAAGLGCAAPAPETVVVYTSVDQPLAEAVLKDFEQKTGVRVQPVYDTEAAKTTGLVSRIVAEASRPRADVFWSSEYAQTLGLKAQGLLDAYDSPAAAGIPASYRDPERYWTGFAARARVFLVNTNLVPPARYPRSIFDLHDPSWGEGEVAIANPLFGTTATHAAALYATIGAAKTQSFFQTLQARKARVVDGNSVVRDMVASGELKVGLTDTDDSAEAIHKGKPVAMLFPDQDGADALGTLIIPNTVAIVRGAPHQAAAKRLVDFLVSAEVEAQLARSGSLQMPVRDGVTVPPENPRLGNLRAMNVTPAAASAQFAAATQWLRDVFLR